MSLFNRRRGLGCLEDSPDERDRQLGELLASSAHVPRSASVAHPLVQARDQRATSSCVGFAFSQAIRLAYLARGVDCPELSPLFAYYLSRAAHGVKAVDAGTYLRTCAHAIRQLGIASNEAWPFDTWKVNTAPTMRAHHSAHDRRGVRGYYRIPSGDTNGIRRAIAAGVPVVFGITVDEDFLDPRGPLLVERMNGRFVGGHAMVVESFHDGGTFTLLNSWGRGYRNDGRVDVTEDVMRMATDVWALEIEP